MIVLIMTVFGVMAVVVSRLSGKAAPKVGRKKLIAVGLTSTMLSALIFAVLGNIFVAFIIGIGLLRFGQILAHSTFLTQNLYYIKETLLKLNLPIMPSDITESNLKQEAL